MQLPPILQGESLTRLLQGAFVGFLATVVIGFGWGGWTLGSTARETAAKSAATAVVAVFGPPRAGHVPHTPGAPPTPAHAQKSRPGGAGALTSNGGPGGASPNSI